MSVQKFFKGDLVFIEPMDKNGPMRYFRGNCEAIVCSSYTEQYGDDRTVPEYSVYLLPSGNRVSWYYESQLTFIAADQFSRLPQDNYERMVFEAKCARDKNET